MVGAAPAGRRWTASTTRSRHSPTGVRTRRASSPLEAGDLNPLSLEPLFALGEIEGAQPDAPTAPRAAYEQAVKLQPASADAVGAAGELRARQSGDSRSRRCASVRPALYLDPRSPAAKAIYLEAYRQSQPKPPPKPALARAGALSARAACSARRAPGSPPAAVDLDLREARALEHARAACGA